MSSKLSSRDHWFFDVSCFHPNEEQVQFLLDTLPKDIQLKVMRQKSLNDQKLSLISAIMQRALIRQTFACSDHDYTIKRTSHNKPYATSEKIPFVNWNYNVSHHGSFVTILSDAIRPIGVDVVKRTVRRGWTGSASEYIGQFYRQLTDAELFACKDHTFEWEQYTHFFVIWCLKEAYIKAVGKGLYMDLLSISFTVKFESLSLENVRGTAIANIDGCDRSDWDFSFDTLDPDHITAVATGPHPFMHKELVNSPATVNILPKQVDISNLLCLQDREKWEDINMSQ